MALLEINGKRYKVIGPDDADLVDVDDLFWQSGMTPRQLQDMFEAAQADGENAPPRLMSVVVFLSRRAAGDKGEDGAPITWDEARRVPIDSINEIPEPGDHATKAKPKPKGEAPADPQ